MEVEKPRSPANVCTAIACGPENVAEFNSRLRAELPAAFELAKALRARGMIAGLRGARIGPVGSLDQRGVVPVLSAAAETRLADGERARNSEKVRR